MNYSPSKRKIAAVDTFANVTYSLGVGAALDYWSGLRGWGIAASRSYATVFNAATGGIYGWWREKIYKMTGTGEDSHWLRKVFAEIAAVDTFAIPAYSSFVAFGSFVSEGQANWDSVRHGAFNIALVSPIVGPTFGWYSNWLRSLFGIKSAAEGAYSEIVEQRN